MHLKPEIKNSSSSTPDLNVLLIFLVALLLRIGVMALMPLYPARDVLPGYNDEPLHLHYVEHIAAGNSWPIWTESGDSLNYLTDAFIHPPTYYSISAPMYRLFEVVQDGWGLYGVRIMSMIFGLIAGLMIYHTALLAFNDSRIATGAMAAGLLAPNAVIFTSITTNDALLYCFSAMALHSLIYLRLGKGGITRELLTAGFIAAAVWTKMSGLTLIPLAWFAAQPWAEAPKRWRSRVRVLLLVIMLIMPLMARNIAHYGQIVPGQRTPLAEEYWPEQAVGGSGGGVTHPVDSVKLLLRYAAVPLMDVWGSLPEKGVSLLWTLFWLVIFSTGACLQIRRKPLDYLYVAAILLVVLGLIYHNLKLYQVEFRLLTPAFPAMAIITSIGADRLKIPPLIQGFIWCVPLILIPFF